MPRRAGFVLLVAAVGLVFGVLSSYRVLMEPGIVGLFHDWAIPPARGQLLGFAKQLFDGWQARGLGAPLDYPADYPSWFLLALAAFAGVPGSVISKCVVVLAPAVSFACLVALARTLGLRRDAALLAGAVYALSPVMLNKLAAGQLSYLFGYALLPLPVATFLRVAREPRPVAGGLAIGGLVALVAMQIQLGAIEIVALLMTAAACTAVEPRKRITILLSAACAFVAIEVPMLVALTLNHAATASIRAVDTPDTLAWLSVNSISPFDVLRLLGYVTHYDTFALGAWHGPWSAAAYAVAAGALLGLCYAPAGVRWVAGGLGAAVILLVTGVHSPLGFAIAWAFVHVPAFAVLRELYHIVAVLALVYAIGIGFLWQSPLVRLHGAAIRWAVLFATVVFVAPLWSGDCGGLLRAQPYDTEMSNAYDAVAGTDRRIAWLPIDQPLAFLESGAGGDPMAIAPRGTLWAYSLSWPLSAVDMYARASRWDTAVAGMRALSVGWVVDRQDFESRLWAFVNGGIGREYFLRRPLQVPRLSSPQHVFPNTLLYPFDGLPLAYGAAGAAYVPKRVEIAAALAGSAYVPFSFDRRLPADIPYIVVTDPADQLDEATLVRHAEIPLPEQTHFPELGFADLASWWYYAPAYAETQGGLLTFGAHTVKLPLPNPLNDGSVIVSWLGTPLGGRMRLTVGDNSVVVDTRAAPYAFRATLLRVGAQPAGTQILIQALDAPAAVAIRAVRVLERGDLDNALGDYARLRHGAQAVVAWSSSTHAPFRRYLSGTSPEVGLIDAHHEYRLELRCQAKQGQYAWVLAPGDHALAYVRIDPPHAAFMEFNGIDDAIHLGGTCDRIISWNLARRRLADARSVTAHLACATGDCVARGVFDGTVASIPKRARVNVLNVTYAENWQAASPGAVHLPTVFGTNAWLVGANAAPVRIENVQTVPFRIAFVVGTLALVCSLVAGLIPLRRRVT